LDIGATFKPFVFWQNYEDYFLNQMAFNASIKLEYRWRPWISLVLDAGYNEFKLPPTPRNNNRVTRYHWWNIVPSIRYYFPFNNFKPYLTGGPGLFMPREGNNRLGFKVGLGFDYSLSDRFIFEIGTEYLYLFEKEGDPHFNGGRFAYQHVHTGISYRLN
jgi:opacity protein-like surface antigen